MPDIDTMLLAVISAGDCYGYGLYKTLSEITGHQFEMKEATLYSGLRRLEGDGLIDAYWGDETQGGRRKYYRITETGRRSLEENVNKWRKTKFIMDKVIDYAIPIYAKESMLVWRGEDHERLSD
jgi:DNA-binding PadR family transcriptional regulator